MSLAEAVRRELERCAVGRDHPVHRRLVAGELSHAELHRFAGQQWLWHRAFPSVLASLAVSCPDAELQAALLEHMHDQHGPDGTIAQWERVCAALGLDRESLGRSQSLVDTAVMIAVQRDVSAREFGVGYLAVMVGVFGELAPHVVARRRAMADAYGVPDNALRYFAPPPTDPTALHVGVAEAHLHDHGSRARALAALQLVLRTRWHYFSGLAD